MSFQMSQKLVRHKTSREITDFQTTDNLADQLLGSKVKLSYIRLSLAD